MVVPVLGMAQKLRGALLRHAIEMLPSGASLKLSSQDAGRDRATRNAGYLVDSLQHAEFGQSGRVPR